MDGPALLERAARHSALGDTTRLAIVDLLRTSDLAPVELSERLGIGSNLLAHHLQVLEQVDLLERHRSSGDRRRRYLRLRIHNLDALYDDAPAPARARAPMPARRALFVCTANSARSQLAAALWRQATGRTAGSAGTHPAPEVHRGAVAAARRAGIDLGDATPRQLNDVRSVPELVVTVCDRAHEELAAPPEWLHWSVTDPVPIGTAAAFDRVVDELRNRIAVLDRMAS